MTTIIETANKFRRSRPHISGGYVLVVNGKACGWKDALRNPEAEIPGTLAINEAGDTWQATGGDDYHGAMEWRAKA